MGVLSRSRERGAAAVEFALIIPMLLGIIFVLLDFGFIFNQQLALTSGAREAARHYAIHWRDSGALDEAKARAASFVGTPVSFPSPILCTNAADAETTITLTTPITDITGLVKGIFGGGSLTAKGVMRCNG